MSDAILNGPITSTGPFPEQSRRLRLGVVGGGRISQTQAMAARMTNRWEIVAGALSSDPTRSKARAGEWFIEPDRAYAGFAEMASAEAARPEGVDAVMLTTPNNAHFPAAMAFLEAGI
ncbi:MAG: Gfo/Idh/MocA family oxidoreductase, partial [Dinoroseobacter sp.]|nr:Gfo/Idh/MocA family oxidoreductase [Dinoroseobacter sp.]